MSDLELIERLLLSAVLGGALGLERELRQKSAGLRTNILIAMGSTLFTMMSIDVGAGSGGDSTRIASGIVTGIGFLGAGAIMRTGAGVKGLTTAAMIWVNAAVGVAVGGGEYRLAVIATIVALVVLVALNPVERLLDRFVPPRRPSAIDDESSEVNGADPSPSAPADPPRSTPPQSATRNR
jgi:putative Mg2+ transporter-C (MgtC) family protein